MLPRYLLQQRVCQQAFAVITLLRDNIRWTAEHLFQGTGATLPYRGEHECGGQATVASHGTKPQLYRIGADKDGKLIVLESGQAGIDLSTITEVTNSKQGEADRSSTAGGDAIAQGAGLMGRPGYEYTDIIKITVRHKARQEWLRRREPADLRPV
jgi:hypothetical protein